MMALCLSLQTCGGTADGGSCSDSPCGGLLCDNEEGASHCGGDGCRGALPTSLNAMKSAKNLDQEIQTAMKEVDKLSRMVREKKETLTRIRS